MNPEKSERKSRRSSILKPPKPRQPFQNVELAVSSAENSPATTTTKVKRRVSFAEKKHVKEFCDSMEQGTVWDNTYEESELSQMKHSENSDTDENIINNKSERLTKEKSQISVVTKTAVSVTQTINMENIKVPMERDFNLDSKDGHVHTKPSGIPFPANHSGSFHARRSLSTTESAFGISSHKEKTSLQNRSVSCPAKVSANNSASGFKQSANIVPAMEDDDCNNISMDETLIGNISVEPTLPTPLTLSKSGPVISTSFNVVTNIDFLKTDPISSIMPHRRVSIKNTSKDAVDPMESNDDQTICSKGQGGITVYQDTSMEITEAVSNRVSIISKHESQTLGDKESNEQPLLVTEEKTTFQIKTVDTVTKILGLSKKDFNELDQDEVNLRPERMPIFHNKSVQSEKVAQNVSNMHLSRELPPVKTKILRNEPVNLIDVPTIQSSEKAQNEKLEQTTVFHDESLELTEAIQNVPSTSQQQKLPSEKTTIFHDKSVDFTSIVQNLPSIEKPQRMSQERTTLFHDKSLEFTEVVRSNDSDRNVQTPSQKSPTKTTDFHNQFMDITEVIPNSLTIKTTEKAPPEKTTIFHNQSLDMTEVIRTCQTYQTQPPEKTTIFQNQSVDMTEVVRSCQTNEKQLPEKTTIFQNQSVEMPEVVQSSQTNENQLPEKTTVFQNQSVEMAEVVRSRQSYETQPPEKTTIFHNQSVDTTKVVRSHKNYEKLPSEKTTIFHNQSVDMTEVVRTCQTYETQPPEQPIFQNQSMDLTEVVRSHKNDEKLPSEKTTIFHNQSVDMTEVVRTCQTYETQPPEKTIFQNQSVDMTEVVRSRQNYEKLPSEKTTIFHNQSVDMTEVVRTCQTYETQPPEKTTIFQNQSVDMTEAVRTCQTYEKPPPEKTAIFHDQSVDISEVVRNHQSHEKPPPEKTTIFHNQSMDMTEAVRDRPNCGTPALAKTTSFQNRSADMTEVARSNLAVDKPLSPETTAILPDKSITNLETIPSDCSLQNPIWKSQVPSLSPLGTSILDNTSTGHNNLETVNEIEQSESQHLDFTEAVSSIPNVSKHLSRDSCTLAMERISKKKPLDSEEANKLIACIDLKACDPEIRSPVPKRMKSLGSRQSLDLTAAVPFVMYRKLARQRPEDIKSTNCNPTSAEDNCETVPSTAGSSNILMDMTEVAAGSSSVDPFTTFPVRAVETFTQEARYGTTNLQNRSMEMTEAIPCHYSLKSPSEVCTDSTDDVNWQRQQNNTICHDDSMEITRVIPGILKVNAAAFHDDSMESTKAVSHHPHPENFTGLNENHGSVVNRRFDALPNSESVTMVFRDDSMELTSGIHLSSQPIDRYCTNVNESENLCPNVIAEVEKDGRTMVYHDDSMELTKAVPFQLQARAQDKENCPPGMEDLESRRSRRPEKKSSIGISKNEWLEIMKSVPFLSSQENKENEAEPVESEIQSRENGSEEITGVVPFLASQENKENQVETIESEKRRFNPESENITGVVAFDTGIEDEKKSYGVEQMEMTEGVRWSSDPNVENSINVCDNVDRQSGPRSIQIFSSADKAQQRHSQVAKELFQKPSPINRSKTINENPTATSVTADLDAEIRKLAETFALTNSVDESGFDQATFLRQQARCMEDYEANSTASQECHYESLPTKNNMSIMRKSGPPDSKKSISPRSMAGNYNRALPTENSAITTDSKIANISIRNNDNSTAQSNCSSRMNREDYDRSLEELRCRAYSVSKFRPEVTGFELTAPISINDPGNLHKSIFDEEPPSYVFSDSVISDATTDCSASAEVLSAESGPPIGAREMPDRMSLEVRHVSVPNTTESVKPLHNDKPEVETISVAEETITFEADDNNSVNDLKNENVERSVRHHRSQTSVTKRPSIDPTILISSSTETDTELKHERLSGLTTAAEFSSESPDGPNEKIRRRESGLTTEERTLPTVDKVGNETELIEIGRSWGTKTFANSTVIGEDCTRQFARQGIEETSIVVDRPSSNEMPSEIVHDVDQIANKGTEVEKVNETMMELEIRAPKSPYAVLKETIERLAERPETIWKIKRLDEQIVAFSFFSRSLAIAIYLKENAIWNSTDPIKVIGFLSQLVEDGSPPNMCLAHRTIMKKISSASLTDSYKTYEDIPRMLEYVTAEVKLGMDFMFELDRLSDRIIMDIKGNSITFTVRTRDLNAGIILNITMAIKPFEEISPDDITIAYLLGREKVRENDIKRLIVNVKRDHRFLRFYINDVRTYIELITESGFSIKKKAKSNI